MEIKGKGTEHEKKETLIKKNGEAKRKKGKHEATTLYKSD